MGIKYSTAKRYLRRERESNGKRGHHLCEYETEDHKEQATRSPYHGQGSACKNPSDAAQGTRITAIVRECAGLIPLDQATKVEIVSRVLEWQY